MAISFQLSAIVSWTEIICADSCLFVFFKEVLRRSGRAVGLSAVSLLSSLAKDAASIPNAGGLQRLLAVPILINKVYFLGFHLSSIVC